MLDRQVDDFKRLQEVVGQGAEQVISVVGPEAHARRVVQIEIAQQLAKGALFVPLEPVPLEGGLRRWPPLPFAGLGCP